MDLFFGIDIASTTFVSYNEDQGTRSYQNTAEPIREYVKSLPQGAVLGIESTGNFGRALAEEAVKAGCTVYLLQPAKVKRFREAGPDRSKTDAVDARVIREYVTTYQKHLHPYAPLPKFEAQLRRLTRTREKLVARIADLRKALRSLGDDAKTIDKTLKALSDRVKAITEQIENMTQQAQDAKVLFTIPGVKTCTVAAVLPALRTIQFKGKYALDSYFGMDLKANESGNFKGKRRMSKEGDKHVRKALYMAAFSACRSKAFKELYQKLVQDKKLKKTQALNALARKILHTIYGVYRTQTNFETTSPKLDRQL